MITHVRWPVAGGGAARDGGVRTTVIAFEDGGVGEGQTEAIAREVARLDGEARRRRVTIADVLAAAPVARVPINAVVDDVDGARAAVARGVRTLKIKLGGGPIADDRARLSAIRTAVPGVVLRGDANGRWPVAEVPARLAALAGLGLAYVEEPAAGLADLLDAPGAPLAVPVALDESLARADREAWLDRALASGAVGALVLKPTVLGVAVSLDLARRARAAGVEVVVTHALDGPVGMAVAIEVARAIGCTAACGLDGHQGLAAWGVEVGGMGAREVTAAGIVDVERVRTFASSPSTSTSTSTGPRPRDLRIIVATPEPSTVAAIEQAWEDERPIGLIHARLPAGEQETARARLARAEVPDGTFAVIFTSGSTGEPKGVVVSRRAAIAAAAASALHLGWREDDRWLLALPLAHAGGLAVVVRCLLARVPAVRVGDDGIAATIARARITLASLVPTQLEALVASGWRAPAHLRAVLVGGAAAPGALIEQAQALGIPALTTYGMTETFGQVATARPGERWPRALPGVRLEAGTRAAPTRIVIDAPSRCGYLGEPAGGPLVTEDLGFLEDGGLHVLGRLDDVIITGGENVHPLAVADALARVPGVAQVCVVGVADPRWGQLVAAAVVPGPGFDREALDRAVAALAPHARPRQLEVVEALPLGPTGKVDRRAVAARLSAAASRR